jgi:hypothetical protein
MTYGSSKRRDWVLAEQHARPFFKRAVKLGITFFDTANKERLAWGNNRVILETRGGGHHLGCNLSVTNFQGMWRGGGDDKIWGDGCTSGATRRPRVRSDSTGKCSPCSGDHGGGRHSTPDRLDGPAKCERVVEWRFSDSCGII